MVVTTTGPVPAEQYHSLPLDPRTQLIQGDVVVDSPNLRHQILSGELYRQLANWAAAGTGRGLVGMPVDVVLDDANVYTPDAWWVTDDHRPPSGAWRLDTAPDLVVEVRSPATWRFDIGVKRARYEAAGVAEVWLVDTAADTLLVFRRSAPAAPAFDDVTELAAGETLTCPLPAGFALDLAALFDR
ncbi:MAG: Uma2 family endonuclease [Acidimicrobiales bacterium]